MKTLTLSLAIAAVGLLAGCQTLPTDSNTTATLRAIHSIQLNEPLTIPAGSATVRLTGGHVVSKSLLQDFDPHCVFELNTVRDTPQQVEPGTYAVTAVQRRIQDFAGMPVIPSPSISSVMYGGGPSQVYYVTEFYLNSPTDPRIRSLSCESNQVSIPAPSQHFLTWDEIHHAVGKYFSFNRDR